MKKITIRSLHTHLNGKIRLTIPPDIPWDGCQRSKWNLKTLAVGTTLKKYLMVSNKVKN